MLHPAVKSFITASSSQELIGIETIVEQALQSACAYLKMLGTDPHFSAKINRVFGNSCKAEMASAIAQEFAKGDFSRLPSIVILPSGAINNANIACVAVINSIYLAKEFVAQNAANPEVIASVLLEQIGNYIDLQVKACDAPGDEGAIFAALVQDTKIEPPEIVPSKAEEDTATDRFGAPKLLEHTILEAHAPETGLLDALRLAEILGFSTEEMAQILNRTSRGLRKNPDSDKLQEDMRKLVKLIARLRYLLDGSMEYVRIWLRSPHPVLGGDTPMSCLLEGKPESVELLIYAMETGQPL